MNSFGRKFRISIFGESHGKQLGVVVDGCPCGLQLSETDFIEDLLRRKSGARGTTPRIEDDEPEIVSGVFEGKTTGAPITIIFKNKNIQSKDYKNLLSHPRPGHADFVAKHKFGGFADYTGGGHFSGRVTLGLVAAGVIAKKITKPIAIRAQITEIGGSKDIESAINQAILAKDSVGGIIECIATNMPIGLGEPFFDSVESVLSHLVFSIPAIKAIEFGAGFEAARMTGSMHNDSIISENGKTQSNHAGGINGGISNGNDLIFRVAIKPTSSIGQAQSTFNFESGNIENLLINGRHDTCIALRIPVIIEAATAIVLADFLLINGLKR